MKILVCGASDVGLTLGLCLIFLFVLLVLFSYFYLVCYYLLLFGGLMWTLMKLRVS
jgi:hypothetical protein